MIKMTNEQREQAIEAIRIEGTLHAGAKAAGVSIRELSNEIKKSAIFKKRIKEAQEEGKQNIADRAIEAIKEIAIGKQVKTDRNVLTANIALANAFALGFRGTAQVAGKIEHTVRVISAVPRPQYDTEISVSKVIPPKLLKQARKDYDKREREKLRQFNRNSINSE